MIESSVLQGVNCGCGAMCEPDSQPPQAVYSTHNNPQSDTGTKAVSIYIEDRHTWEGTE